jgi:quercetin dioxygenase-like cupin family protein
MLPAVVLATPASGVKSATVYARASFVDSTGVNFAVHDGSQVKAADVANARETVTQEIVLAPGGTTGWHSHPGPVVVLIKSGQMAFYDSEDPTCTATIYSAGQSFVDAGQGHVHIANNEGNVELDLWATYFDVPAGGAFRIDAADPGQCTMRLANLSTRGLVQMGDNILIAGFIMRSANPGKVIVRAIGPSLPLTGKLEDPTLELFDRNGVSIATNDNWADTQQAEITATGIPPANARESAIVRTLAPGAYTAIVRGANNTTGMALVEVYSLQ